MLYMNGKQVQKYGELPTLREVILGNDCCIMCLAEQNTKEHRKVNLRRSVPAALARSAVNEVAFAMEILKEELKHVFEG